MSTEPPSSTDTDENSTSDKKVDTDYSIRKASENISEKMDLTKTTSKLIDKIAVIRSFVNILSLSSSLH
jgi:hypothetical protein